jgi:hypothetical protein
MLAVSQWASKMNRSASLGGRADFFMSSFYNNSPARQNRNSRFANPARLRYNMRN